MIRFASSDEVIDNNYLSTWSSVNTFESNGKITFDAQLSSNFDITIKAGSEVKLLPEVELESGAQLEILIEACNN